MYARWAAAYTLDFPVQYLLETREIFNEVRRNAETAGFCEIASGPSLEKPRDRSAEIFWWRAGGAYWVLTASKERRREVREQFISWRDRQKQLPCNQAEVRELRSRMMRHLEETPDDFWENRVEFGADVEGFLRSYDDPRVKG